jgi:hypothetical protein
MCVRRRRRIKYNTRLSDDFQLAHLQSLFYYFLLLIPSVLYKRMDTLYIILKITEKMAPSSALCHGPTDATPNIGLRLFSV